MNITDNSLIKNPKRKNKFIINNNGNNINKSGSGKSINLLDIDIKPIFSRRNVINYNEVNISKSNSSRKIIRNRIPDDKISQQIVIIQKNLILFKIVVKKVIFQLYVQILAINRKN